MTPQSRPPRCPRCRSHDTAWTPKDELRCLECGVRLSPPRHDAANWEASDWERRVASWSDYEPRERLARFLASADERLDAVIAERGRPLEIEEVRAIFAGAIGPNPSPVEIELIGALALLMWGARVRATKIRRDDPKRSPFATLGQVLRFRAGTIGVGSGGWRSSVDGPRLEIAETRRPAAARAKHLRGRALDMLRLIAPDVADALFREQELRRIGGMRSGVVHATVSSHNGSTGGAPGLTAKELECDVNRAIRAAAVDSRAVMYLSIKHREPKPNQRAAVEAMLRDEGLVEPGMTKAQIDPIVAEHRHRCAKYLARATKLLEAALRAVPAHGIGGDDARDERLPRALHGAPREPVCGFVPLLRPGEDGVDEAPVAEASDRPEVKPIGNVPMPRVA